MTLTTTQSALLNAACAEFTAAYAANCTNLSPSSPRAQATASRQAEAANYLRVLKAKLAEAQLHAA